MGASDEKKPARPLGFAFNHQMMVDPEHSEMIQATYTCDEEATAEDIAKKMATVAAAVWTRIRENNKRKLELADRVKEQRQKQIDAARQAKRPLNEQAIRKEDADLNASLVKLSSEVLAAEDPPRDETVQ